MYVFRCPRCSCTLLTPLLDPILSVGKQMLLRPFRCSSKLAKDEQSSASKHTKETEGVYNRRMNPLGIQMLSKQLHKQIFGDFEPAFSRQAINRSRKHLKEQGLWEKEGSILPDIDVNLPHMLRSDINKHFEHIAKMQCEPYLNLALKLAGTSLPPMPKEWQFESGWTQYDPKTGKATKIDCPQDNALVFDVEVCVRESPRPILATAASLTHWYSWVSRRLCSDEDFYAGGHERKTVLEDLIPLESVEGSVAPLSGDEWQERLVVGHNVSYDRARIKEQYLINGTRTRFLDTMSLHVCVAGQTTHQKIKWLSTFKKLDKKNDNTEEDVEENGQSSSETDFTLDGNGGYHQWMDVSSPNSLAHVHRLYAGGRRVKKAKRDVFVKGSVMDIRNDFQNLMKYCAKDVFYTHEVLEKVLPLFLQRCPHPVTLAGMFEMGSAYLPVDHSWEQYLDDAEYTYKEMQDEMRAKLMALADNACSLMTNNRYTQSPWLCNLDWSARKFRGKAMKNAKAMTNLLSQIEQHYEQEAEEFERCDNSANDCDDGSTEHRFEFLISSMEPKLPSRPVHMPGYPEWYRALCMKRTDPNWRPGAVNVTAQTRVTPYLLRMKWNGHPLYHHPKLGWGYIIAPENVADFENEDLESDDVFVEDRVEGFQHVDTSWGLTDDVVTLGNDEQFYFFKIPHKDGADANCGNPLSKDYLSKMEDGTLTSGAGHLGQRILTLNTMMSFWRSARSRILQQFVVWMGEDTQSSDGEIGKEMAHQKPSEVGAILPIVQVAGTATRRAVEPTWLTASNAKETRVGSEQKAMIRSPPGYHFVGADVDSQELWIAAVLGDMHFAGIHGSTAIGWMTLQGKKSDGTDVHSNTAKTIGVSRDHAKILNYGRIYGAGKPFMELLLAKFNPSLTSSEVKEKANLLLTATKGRRVYKLPKKHHQLAKDMNIVLHDGHVDYEDWKMLRDVIGYFNTERGVMSRIWEGGSESQLFNKLESIAMSNHPKTPVLQCSISKALEKDYVNYDYQPSKINWVVQSSAVDYLHLMLVFNRWLFDLYNIDGRFCISIHDEVRYLVKSEDRYRAALALQYSNLFTRAMFSYQLRMYDLPQSVAFFSAVDIDTVLRKEATMDCKTPSNPLGLERGHNIPFGEVLDIYQILEKTGGSLSK